MKTHFTGGICTFFMAFRYFAGLEEAVRQISPEGKSLAYIGPNKAFGSRGFVGLLPGDSHVVMWLCVESAED